MSIAAPIDRVFDLARSIDLHLDSTSSTGERAVGGVTTGLIRLGEEVTWQARHFGVWQSLRSHYPARSSAGVRWAKRVSLRRRLRR